MLIYSQGHLLSWLNSETSREVFKSGLCQGFDRTRPWCLYKALFPKFSLIICAEAWPTQQAPFQAVWYAFLCIRREEPLSGHQAGRFSSMMDNFCFTTCSVVFCSFFPLFTSWSLQILSLDAKSYPLAQRQLSLTWLQRFVIVCARQCLAH